MKGQRSESILAEVNCFVCLPGDRVLLSNSTVRLIDLCLRVRKVLFIFYLFIFGFLFLHRLKNIAEKGRGLYSILESNDGQA